MAVVCHRIAESAFLDDYISTAALSLLTVSVTHTTSATMTIKMLFKLDDRLVTSVGFNLELVTLIALLHVPLARHCTNVKIALHHPLYRVEMHPHWHDQWSRAGICAQERELPQTAVATAPHPELSRLDQKLTVHRVRVS